MFDIKERLLQGKSKGASPLSSSQGERFLFLPLPEKNVWQLRPLQVPCECVLCACVHHTCMHSQTC